MFSWIKSKWRSLKHRWMSEWEDYNVIRFENFVDDVGAFSMLGFMVNGVVSLIVSVMSGLLSISAPIFYIWCQYFIFTFGLPSLILVISAILLSKYLENWRRRRGPDTRWWTPRKVDKLRRYINVAAITLIVIQVLGLGLMAHPLWASYVFLPEFMPNIVALKLLYKSVFIWPLNILVPVVAWSNWFVLKFYFHLNRLEIMELENRLGRDNGSMRDWADEDEILECKLERLGL